MLLIFGVFGRLWTVFMSQFAKIGRFFYEKDPIAIMEYQYDQAVEQLKSGREGVEQFRGLVNRVQRQVDTQQKAVTDTEAKIKTYLQAGDRESAGKYAVALSKAQKELAENSAQLKMHEESYQNNITKIKHASKKLGELKDKITKYGADLKMSAAEAELAKVASTCNFDVTTDFGEVESMIQEKIDTNRGKARVAADMSGEGIVDIKQEEAMEKVQGEDLLKQFEIQQGLRTPETEAVPEMTKDLGPAVQSITG